MFLRRKKTNTGTVLQLVESFRSPEGQPRQRVRLSLGDAPIPEVLWPEILRGVEDRLSCQASLFGEAPSGEAANWVDQIIRRLEARSERRSSATRSPAATVVSGATVDGVLLDGVTHGDTTALGPSLVALHAWNELQMPKLLNQLGFNEIQQKALTINVINRLVDPVSENRLPEWLYSTSLPELLGRASLPTANDRFYRVCDQALKHKATIEAHLREREQSYFSLDRTVVLYDLTNTYFEGVMGRNPKAKRGNSKEKRNDCPQLVVGVAFDRKGFALTHEIFAGNQNDAASLVRMVDQLQKAAGAVSADSGKPLVIVDGGIASKENRKRLADAGLEFLANESRPGRNKYAQWFAEDDLFTAIPGRRPGDAVFVRMLADPLASSPEEADTLILCKSAGRGKKERAMLSKAEERFLAAAAKLAERVAKGRLHDSAKIERAIGRLLAQHPRVARYYDVTLSSQEVRKIEYARKDGQIEEAEELHGSYLLRTSSNRLEKAEDWWNLYITLTRAEDGFRALKSDLGLRPVRHHREDRGDSHILVSMLAYHLMQCIIHPLREKEDQRSWETIRRILSTHCYTTIVLPTIDGAVHRLRKPGQPDARQQEIYDRLGVQWQGLPTTHLVV